MRQLTVFLWRGTQSWMVGTIPLNLCCPLFMTLHRNTMRCNWRRSWARLASTTTWKPWQGRLLTVWQSCWVRAYGVVVCWGGDVCGQDWQAPEGPCRSLWHTTPCTNQLMQSNKVTFHGKAALLNMMVPTLQRVPHSLHGWTKNTRFGSGIHFRSLKTKLQTRTSMAW